MPRRPGDGEGQGTGGHRRARAPRPSPSDLSPEERLTQAHAAALRLLSHRERSRSELVLRLKSKGYDRDTVDRVLDGLAESGLQSDRRFAETLASEAKRSRGLAAGRIQGELRRRGVGVELAAEAGTETPESEEARAHALASRRVKSLAGLPSEVRIRRLVGFLARRGFSSEVALRVARDQG